MVESKQKMNPAQKREAITSVVGIVVCLIVAILMYKYWVNPLGTAFGLSRGWIIGISIAIFFCGYGTWAYTQNMSGFYEKANRQLAQQSTANQEETPTDKIKELKGLLDSGAITKEEFKKKKKELLKKI